GRPHGDLGTGAEDELILVLRFRKDKKGAIKLRNESALAHFRDEVIRPQRQIMLEQLEQTYQGWRPELIREFIASFRAWCRQLLELQAAGKKGRIGYLTYSMLRTAMQSGKMTYLGEAQDEN